MPTAIKSVKQIYAPTIEILDMMETFRRMVNDAIRIGLQHDVSSMKRLCSLSYVQFQKYDIISYYKLCAISKAAGILINRKKSIKRDHKTKTPYMRQPILISCYGFKVENDMLKVPLGDSRYFEIPLDRYGKQVLASDPAIKIRSFTLTPAFVSICFTKEIVRYEPQTAIGIDRNLANVSVGNSKIIVQYSVDKLVQIAENTRSVTRAFRRNDVRIRRRLLRKHGQRRKNRTNQLLHKLSKIVVPRAKKQKAVIVFEDIRYIRGLYLHGNGRGGDHRAKMNSWPFHELERQIEYKASWEGVPVVTLTKAETRGTSQLCPRCGKRTQLAERSDVAHKRQLWCEHCKRWMDRDVIAPMNIAYKGWLRFDHPQGAASEAMVQESDSKEPVILKVDAAKNIASNLKA